MITGSSEDCHRSPADWVFSLLRSDTRKVESSHFQSWTEAEWNEAVFQVQIHGLAPYLFTQMKPIAAWQTLDLGFRSYLKDQYAKNQLRILRISRILESILKAVDEKRVPVIPLKGSVLIRHYLADPAQRPMADIDLLVPGDREEVIEDILKVLGYRQSHETVHHRVYSDGTNAVDFRGEHPDNPVTIELHSSVVIKMADRYESFDIELGGRWTESEEQFQGVWKLTGAALFFHLACHTAQHVFHGAFRAVQLLDLVHLGRILDRRDWETILCMADDCRMNRMLYVALALGERHAGLKLPGFVLPALESGTPQSLRMMIQTESLSRFIMVNDERMMRFLSADVRKTSVRCSLALYRLSLKYVFYFPMNLTWAFPGKEKVRAIKRLILPGKTEMSYWYPNWIQRFGIVLSYFLHGILLLILPFVAVLGIDRRHAHLGFRIRKQIWSDEGFHDQRRPNSPL